jgi:hypothetical protein
VTGVSPLLSQPPAFRRSVLESGTLLFASSLIAAVVLLGWLYWREAPLRASIAFHHMASVRELAKGEFPPRHNLVDGFTPQGHYGPYLVVLGALARWTGAHPLLVLEAAGLVNLIAFAFAFRAVAERLVSPQAASWSVLVTLLLWGPWPARVMHWSAWGWPGTTSIADAQNFFYPQQAGVILLILVLLTVTPLASGESLADESRRSLFVRWLVAALLAALLITTHSFTAIALPPALLALTLSERRGPRPLPALALVAGLPAAALALSALWPYYPVLGLLRAFTVPGFHEPLPSIAASAGARIAGTLPAGPPLPDLGILGPALVGLVGTAALAFRGQSFTLLWLLVNLLFSAFPLLPLRQRFFMFCALPLHLGATWVLAWASARGWAGRTLIFFLLAAGAYPATQRIRWVLGQEPLDLRFVADHTPENAIVLADPRTSNAVAGLTGRKIVAPEGPDLFLLMEGGGERTVDVQRFLERSTSPEERLLILRRWRVTHVLVDRLGEGGPELPYPRTYEGGGYVLYDVSRLPGPSP